jgi:hypothetical protein
MREILERIMELQPNWTSIVTVEMEERGQLIRRSGPEWLREHTSALADAVGVPPNDLMIEGRDGTGPKTEVPWFRFGSRSRSPSATIGWYCVYLFPTDGQTAYLTVGRGSTEWNGVDFKPRDHDELRTQASWARGILAGDVGDLEEEIDLKSRRSPLGPSYEAGTVVAREYHAGGVPEAEVLLADAIRMGKLLQRVYAAEDSDPAAPGVPPEVREAVRAAAETAGKRPPRTSAGFQPNALQRSAVEKRGMDLVKQALVEWGWEVVVDTSASKPYDFRCTSGEDEVYVEVKATIGDGTSVILTRNEVDHVHANYPNTALALVTGVVPPTQDGEPASGGSISFIHPWQVSDADLSIISYVYSTPADAAEPWS